MNDKAVGRRGRWVGLLGLLVLACGAHLSFAGRAAAFCGFYVSGADASLYSNATMVVMMREGRRTVLSMQNNYQGPANDFAMVVPVPVVLQEDNVRTLDREVFERVDQLAAPRLVEYWEQDPCAPPVPVPMMAFRAMPSAPDMTVEESGSGGLGVTVEAQFTVEEYEIVILSARDSNGLDTWLRQENYNIPTGAEEVLRPYVEQGTKFFVAKVDSSKVTFENGRAVLSPLRMHYDTDEFSLPVRLGLLNSSGQQDLIVHILAQRQRYEVANYHNNTIPTNLRVKEDVRGNFAGFYDLLFRRAAGGKPKTVVTEYSWDASSCDPCPVPALSPQEIATLGGDVVGRNAQRPTPGGPAPSRPVPGGPKLRVAPPPPPMPMVGGFVLTRLHYRYGQGGLGEDLVFRAAPAIVGGRGMPNPDGVLQEQGAQQGSINNFQGRYVLLNRWTGAISCDNPRRGMWGGPPGSGGIGSQPRTTAPTNPAMSMVPSDLPMLASIGPFVEDSLPQLGIEAGVAEAPLAHDPGPVGGRGASTGGSPAGPTETTGPATQAGCASCSAGSGASGLLWLSVLAVAFAFSRQRFRA